MSIFYARSRKFKKPAQALNHNFVSEIVPAHAEFAQKCHRRSKKRDICVRLYLGSRYRARLPLLAIFWMPIGLNRLIRAVSLPSSPVTSMI